MIVPTAVMGTVRNRSRGNTDLRAAVIVGVAGMVTAALGGLVSDRMSATSPTSCSPRCSCSWRST